MIRGFSRSSSRYNQRDDFVWNYRSAFAIPFIFQLQKVAPNSPRGVTARSLPYEVDGASRRRFQTLSNHILLFVFEQQSSSSFIEDVAVRLVLQPEASGASSVFVDASLVLVLEAQGSGSSTANVVNLQTYIYASFEVLATLELTEEKASRLVRSNIFFPSTSDLLSQASAENQAIYLNSLLGAIIQGTHPTEINGTNLDIKTISGNQTLFQRQLVFDGTLEPIKKID